MEANSAPQNVSTSLKKKKKKKKKKKNAQGRTTPQTDDQNKDSDYETTPDLPSSSSLHEEESKEFEPVSLETNTLDITSVDEGSGPDEKHVEDKFNFKSASDMSLTTDGAVGDGVTNLKPLGGNSHEQEEVSDTGPENLNPEFSLPVSKEAKSSSPCLGKKKATSKGFLLSETLNSTTRDSKVEMENEAGIQNDLKRFTDERWLLEKETKERNNLYKLTTLMYKTGLESLRKLFKEIHPSWRNEPDDAKNLNKGKMTLQQHELNNFNTGDIQKWDISLITTVLLYSKKCHKKISKKTGVEDAIRTLRKQKNLLISHPNSEKMSDDEFQQAWSSVSNSLKKIGASSEEIKDIYSQDCLEMGKFYRDKLLKELADNSAVYSEVQSVQNEVKQMHTTMQDMSDKINRLDRSENQASVKTSDPPDLQEFDTPEFDEWTRFCDKVHNFDYHNNNYILVTDKLSSENLKYFSVLRTIPWKIVLDFDPCSEEKGMYHDFVNSGDKTSLIDMSTPDEMQANHSSTINFARTFDAQKTQWMFVNGREKDNFANKSLQEWKKSSLKHISRFLLCASDPEKMDKHRPVVVIILPFQDVTIPCLTLTLDRVVENFDEFHLQFVSTGQQNIPTSLQEQFIMHLTNLSPRHLGAGLNSILQVSPEGKEYKMPTFQAKLPVKLTNSKYLYLQEYLEVMYHGCEDLPLSDDEEEEEKLERFFSEHRESFLSGNWITFVSLFDNHDAERELGKEICDYIQRHLAQERRHTSIIEIRHAPGTGGTTIARRVLWNLHKSVPCAIARLGAYKYDIDDDFVFISDLADRINALQEHCQTTPLILLDGNHSRIEGLTTKLLRVLNARGQRVLLLSCLHLSAKPNDFKDDDITDVYKQFVVNANLEDSLSDLRQFEVKYREYVDKIKKTDTSSPTRVFHFPLLAMLKGLEGFSAKLKQIVYKSFDGMDGLRKQIAAIVAFIQLYASQETPGSLLYQAFKKYVCQDNVANGITYKDINHLITDHLLNLMVPAKPRKRPRQASTSVTSSSVTEKFTLQHPLVAELVLQRYYETQKLDVFSLTRQFLEFPILQNSEFFSLINALFIRNRSTDPKARFSILFEELRSRKPNEAAKLFTDLAKKTGDAIMFCNAARFHAKMNPPRFRRAKELISEAMKCNNAESRSRIVWDFNGQILQSELKCMVETQKIDSISLLEKLANEAIQSYDKARNWPITYPVPLMGQVKVWISCIEWITKNKCDGDTDKAFEFISSDGQEGAPPFFRTCFGDSFYLLDIVDGIVQTNTNLAEPMDIQQQANKLRLSLLRTFTKVKGKKQARRELDQDSIRVCEALCSIKKFPKCSPIELKRLQVHFILNNGDVETANKEVVQFLLKLLEDLVNKEKQSARLGMARHLMRVCILAAGPKHYSLEMGLDVTEVWMKESVHDPMPHFHRMMIAFMMILDGNQVSSRDVYLQALEKCKDKSQNHYRRFVSTHFLKNTGEGMNRLMTKGALLTGEKEYLRNVENFWTSQSRKKLKECDGRIKYRTLSGKRKQAYIELVKGNIELYVAKNADIGSVEQDYPQGTLVYFVVSFNLTGPVANGITFEPKSNQGQASSK